MFKYTFIHCDNYYEIFKYLYENVPNLLLINDRNGIYDVNPLYMLFDLHIYNTKRYVIAHYIKGIGWIDKIKEILSEFLFEKYFK